MEGRDVDKKKILKISLMKKGYEDLDYIHVLSDREESWVSITSNAKQAQLIYDYENTKQKVGVLMSKGNVGERGASWLQG
jgi:hypothetical protein